MEFKGIIKSPKEDKKWRAIFEKENGKTKTVDFGAKGMDDFTLTKDEDQAKRYRERHKKDLETGDPTRAGFLSYYVLWSHPSLRKGIEEYRRRFF